MSSYSMANRAPWRPLVLGLTLSVGLGCGGDGPTNPDRVDDAGEDTSDHHDHDAGSDDHEDTGSTADVDSKAADLRVTLDLLLGEHLIFAAKATGAALGGRSDEYNAYGALLGKNGTDVGKLVGEAFGDAAEAQFNGIWSAHNSFFVEYTTGVASHDQAKQQKAVDSLTNTYVPAFSKLIADATGLPLGAVTDLTTEHVLKTKAIVDAQAKQDWPAAYAATREGFAHMQMIGDALSQAIAGKLADTFPGNPAAKGVDLRVALNQLLQEHMYLASFATGAALGGRNDEFAAAGAALNENGTDVGGAVGQLFGKAAETELNRIWSAHNGFFVDYTTAVATHDQAKQKQAVDDLTKIYVPEFAAFLAGATDLPEATLASLTTGHVVATKAVVDLQAAGNESGASTADREAAQHMQMMADPLASAIVAKLPDSF